jgi:hypothetical protein
VGLNTHDYLYKLPTLCELLIFSIWNRDVTTAVLCMELGLQIVELECDALHVIEALRIYGMDLSMYGTLASFMILEVH